jgi:hypothetical protein
LNHRSNHRLFLRTSASSLFACSALAFASQAFGQAAPIPGATPATAPVALPVPFPASLMVSKSTGTFTPAQTAALNDYVKKALDTIATSSSPGQVKTTRETFEGAAMIGPGQPAKPVYEQAFVAAVSNVGLAELKKADVRGRTAVAVAINRVVIRTRNAGLTPVVLAMLADKSEAVATWGVRSGRSLYLPLLTTSPKDAAAISQGMLTAMRTYLKSEGILEDAFEGLAGKDVQTFALPNGAPPNMQAIDTMIALLETRAQTFEGAMPGALPENDPKFPAVIPAPKNETGPEAKLLRFFLANDTKQALLNAPKQRAAMARAIYDLCDQMIRLAPLLPPAAAPNAPEIRRGDLASILVFSASSLSVVQGATPALAGSAKGLQDLAREANDQVGMQGKLQEIEKEMTAANLLGPKPAPPPVPVSPAPTTPKPAVAPAKTGGASGAGTTAAKPAGAGNAAAGNSSLNK